MSEFDIKTQGTKIEAEIAAQLDKEMRSYVAARPSGAAGGWSVKDHSVLLTTIVSDISLSELDAEEEKYRFYVLFRHTANYSSFRQKYEKLNVLAAGQRATAESLAAEYLGSM